MLAKCKLESLNATDHFRGLGVNGLVVSISKIGCEGVEMADRTQDRS